MILLHGIAQLKIFGILHVQKTGPAPDHEELADFFFKRQLMQCFLGPFLATGSKPNRAGVLKLFLRKSRCRDEEDASSEREYAAHAENDSRPGEQKNIHFER